MKKIHLLCNAHIDPVWLWQRNEGVAETISTFRIAADFCEKYDGFVFNHNEAVLYEWIMEYDAELFKRIKALVKQGKWRIMGGWYLQPDCVMLSGESLIRQIKTGHDFFKKHFGAEPRTAINFDPFGHSRGLVQILSKCGYNSYVFMRPDSQNCGDFIWKGFDGSEILCHKIYGGYNTLKGKAIDKIKDYINEYPSKENNLILWGIGNHGGGPSRRDLEAINKFILEQEDYNIEHSYCENYFNDVDMSKLAVRENALDSVMVGCYTSMTELKHKYRKLENDMYLCELMLCDSDVEYDKSELDKAEKALLFSQFHDILPGTAVKKTVNDSIRLIDYSGEILDRYISKAFFSLCGGQRRAEDGEIPIMVYNPHPYEIEADIEAEFQLADQNWNEDETTVVYVKNEKGQYIPCQNEKEDCTFNLDWRKKTVFSAVLKPTSINRFDCELKPQKDYMRIQPCEMSDTHIIVQTENIHVEINRNSGLIDKYAVNGDDILKCGAGEIEVYRDNEDPWGMRVNGFYDRIGTFKLLSDSEANEFNGYPDESIPNVRVIENGEVRTKVQAIFRYRETYAVVTYIVYKKRSYMDMDICIYSNNVNVMYKLAFDTKIDNSKYVTSTAFGHEIETPDGSERVFGKWCMLKNDMHSFAVLNRGIYGGSAADGKMYVNLLRTPVYAAHPIKERPIAPSDRSHSRIDMGERSFNIRLCADIEYAEQMAEVFNVQPVVLSFFPDGSGEKKTPLIHIDNKNIILTSIKKDNDAILFRLYNSSSDAQNTKCVINGYEEEFCLKGFEVKTYRISGGKINETDMLGMGGKQ